MINIFFEDTEILDLHPEFFVSWFGEVCKQEGRVLGDINLICCSDDYLLEINKAHLDHDFYTDIITFDYSDDNISGDLFVSVQRVLDNSENLKIDFMTELNRVVVHGVLHLLGYMDKLEAEKIAMTKAEDKYLKLIVPRET